MSLRSSIFAICVSALVGGLSVYFFLNHKSTGHDVMNATTSAKSQDKASNEPLYWVAPMDPNFKRDQPGKSPMGMDLVPVYADDNQDTPGTITIDPSVVNNLGVRTDMAKMHVFQAPIDALGYVNYSEDTLVHIHPRVAGWVEKLYVNTKGAYIEKGQPLYTLYSPELVNAQEEYLLALSRNNRQLIAAAESRLRALQLPEQVILRLKEDKKVMQEIAFTAPQTGFIDNLNIREGFYVMPANTMMSISALDEVWVDAQIFAKDSAKIRVGLPVTMTVEHLPDRQFEGKINYVYPSLNADTRSLQARVAFDNSDYALKPNMFAQLSIQTAVHDDAILPPRSLVVPNEAVIRTGQQDRVVLALGEGKFKSLEVELGQISEGYTEILSGLMAGDEVVTSAQFLLDSESSISSDFKRMSANKSMSGQIDMGEQADMPQSVSTHATINDVMLTERKLNLSHGELPEWGMPAMTMDFMAADTIDLSTLESGMQVHITLSKHPSGMYQVDALHSMPHEQDQDMADMHMMHEEHQQ